MTDCGQCSQMTLFYPCRVLSSFARERAGCQKVLANQQGFTYIMVMFMVIMIGISLMVIGQQWSITMKRDREAELLFRGNRMKEAIERFAADFEVQKGLRPYRYPRSLKELTQKPRRYLPVVYDDPLTGKTFELIKVGGEIRGVRSRSTEQPFDHVNFKGAQTYHDIRFEATGATTNCSPNPLNPVLSAPCPQGRPSSSQAPGPGSKGKSGPSP